MTKYAPKTVELKGVTVSLREAEPEDASAAVEFLARISEETPFTYNYPGQQLSAENQSKRFLGEKSSPHNIRILALGENKILGQIGCWRGSPDHPWLKHKAEFAMMVRNEWWGSGLAKLLLSEMETFARTVGITRIEATVNCANERGVALYSKFGYAIEGTAKGYKVVDGNELDSFFIAKRI